MTAKKSFSKKGYPVMDRLPFRSIIKAYENGQSIKRLAAYHKCSRDTIYRVLKGANVAPNHHSLRNNPTSRKRE